MIISSRPGDKGYSPYCRQAIKHVMFNGIDIKHMVHYVNTWLGICKRYKTWPWHEYVWADGSWPAYGSWSKDAFPPLEVCTMYATTLDVVFNDGWGVDRGELVKDGGDRILCNAIIARYAKPYECISRASTGIGIRLK